MTEKHKLSGIMVGILVCQEHGTPFVAVDINGERLAMSPDQAGFLLDQLSMHLEVLGYFDDEGEPVKEDERVLN